jgi:hypothetical protein
LHGKAGRPKASFLIVELCQIQDFELHTQYRGSIKIKVNRSSAGPRRVVGLTRMGLLGVFAHLHTSA